jgi:hypothetical protein
MHREGGSKRSNPRARADDLPKCSCGVELPHAEATHCQICHASWTRRSNTSHCATCHRTFAGPSVFDRHLLNVGCTDPATVRSKKGVARFEPEPERNRWGTPVWHLAGKRPPSR